MELSERTNILSDEMIEVVKETKDILWSGYVQITSLVKMLEDGKYVRLTKTLDSIDTIVDDLIDKEHELMLMDLNNR